MIDPNTYEHLHKKFDRLLIAATKLYFSAYWHADRPVDEQALWTELRDAAHIAPGQTGKMLGPDRSIAAVCESSKEQP